MPEELIIHVYAIHILAVIGVAWTLWRMTRDGRAVREADEREAAERRLMEFLLTIKEPEGMAVIPVKEEARGRVEERDAGVQMVACMGVSPWVFLKWLVKGVWAYFRKLFFISPASASREFVKMIGERFERLPEDRHYEAFVSLDMMLAEDEAWQRIRPELMRRYATPEKRAAGARMSVTFNAPVGAVVQQVDRIVNNGQ